MNEPLPLVIYHRGCLDGFAAAWVTYNYLFDKLGEKAELDGRYHGHPPPDVTGRPVYIVDFSYPLTVLEEMNDRSAGIVLIDHHKTAQAELGHLPYCHFDMKKSGAGLAWDYLCGGERPWFIDYVEDGDLWLFKKRASREIYAALQMEDKSLDNFDQIEGLPPKHFADKGRNILDVQANYHASMRTYAYRARLPGVEGIGLGVNAGKWGASELLDLLAEDSMDGYSFAWVHLPEGAFYYSLRSRKNGPDVSEVATRFGGGGHKHSAGFRTKVRVDNPVRF